MNKWWIVIWNCIFNDCTFSLFRHQNANLRPLMVCVHRSPTIQLQYFPLSSRYQVFKFNVFFRKSNYENNLIYITDKIYRVKPLNLMDVIKYFATNKQARFQFTIVLIYSKNILGVYVCAPFENCFTHIETSLALDKMSQTLTNAWPAKSYLWGICKRLLRYGSPL